MWRLTDFFMNVGLGAMLPTALIITALIATYLVEAVRRRLDQNWPLPRSPWLLAILIVVLGIPLGCAFQGSFFYEILTFAGVVWFIAPCLLVLGVAAIVFRVRTKRVPADLRAWLMIFAACVPALGLSFGASMVMDQWQIAAARAYVERAMPVLDGIKKSTGVYPATLPDSALGAPPRLLRAADSYNSDGKEFHFYYSDPAALGEGSQIDSTSRVWSYFDPMG